MPRLYKFSLQALLSIQNVNNIQINDICQVSRQIVKTSDNAVCIFKANAESRSASATFFLDGNPTDVNKRQRTYCPIIRIFN